jgi:flagellar biosynthesis protein
MSQEKTQPPNTAVALIYDGKSAPRVVAKGKGHVAEEIIARAKAHGVPLKEEPELVNLLAQVDLGREIPEALYVAVAQVIAFACRLRGTLPNHLKDRRQVSPPPV